MGNGTSKATPKKNGNGMFNKELEHAFNSHSYKDPYVPLILIQAHSNEPENMIELPEGVQLFHYCKKGCILRTKKTKISENNAASNATSNTERSISMEYACLKKLDIYDTYETKSPNYNFYIDEVYKKEGGVYLCLDKEIRKVFPFEPGQLYSIGMIIHFIENKLKMQKINIGVLSCRTTNACSNVVVALPGPHSKHANQLNPSHSPFRYTFNKNREKRKGIPLSLAMMNNNNNNNNKTRKTKRKR
jgi:hypothetical protein